MFRTYKYILAPNGTFDVDIKEWLNLVSGSKIIKRGGSHDSYSFYDQVVKVGEGWVELELVLLIIAELANEYISHWISTTICSVTSHERILLSHLC